MQAFIYKWHRKLALTAGICTLLWVFSGLLHPFVSYWGPRPAAFIPPANVIEFQPSAASLREVAEVVAGRNIRQLRLVAAGDDVAWQVSLQVEGGTDFLYFDALNGKRRPDFPMIYAAFLARHYTGSAADIVSVQKQDVFDSEYPEINRLLPVYKVSFADSYDLAAYVDPATGRLGALTDDVRAAALKIFRAVHTFSFLERAEVARVSLVLLGVLSILCVAAFGFALRVSRKTKAYSRKARTIHAAAAWLLWLPVFMMTLSGMFHLAIRTPLAHEDAVPSQAGFLMPDDLTLPHLSGDIHDLRLVARGDEALWIAMGKDGLSYTDAGGNSLSLSEEGWARGFAGLDDSVTGQKITRFTPEYGFAYKRLPVWRFEDDRGAVFVDAAEGLVSARVTPLQAAETWSFTTFHKWQLLDPLMGRIARDAVLVTASLLIAAMAVTGLVLRFRRG